MLNTAVRYGWIAVVPGLSAPFRGSCKVSHRLWFSPAEYKSLYEATRENAKTARAQDRWSAEQLHDYVLFMGNTGLCPDEVKDLQHRDIEIVRIRLQDSKSSLSRCVESAASVFAKARPEPCAPMSVF